MSRYKELPFLIIVFLVVSLTSACGESEAQPVDPIDTLTMMEEGMLIGCDYPLYPPSDTIIATHTAWTKTNYKNRINNFKTDTITSGSIVMLGNSLTEQGGNWSTKLGVGKAFNRGIAGDNCDGALARLGEIMCAQPSMVFIMIGTNDLWTNYSPTQVGDKIDQIGKKLADSLPEAKVIVQTLMPLGEGQDTMQRLDDINTAIKAFENRPYLLIDTHTAMANDDGILAADLTTDGVHLTAAGYTKWVFFLKGYLQ